jgi:uncharacterized protein YceK
MVMPNANLKLVVAVALAAGMVSGCAELTTQDSPPAGYSKESQALYATALREMKQRQMADPQVPGWALVNPQAVRFTADP